MLLHAEFNSEGDLLSIGLSVMHKNGNQLRYVTDNPTEATQEHQPDWIQAPRLAEPASQALTMGQAPPSNSFANDSGISSHRR
jgi:hypothetical protein